MAEETLMEMESVQDLIGSAGLAAKIVPGPNDEYYLTVGEPAFDPLVTTLASRKCVLIGLFCTEGFSPDARFSLLYVFEKKNIVLILVRNSDGTATSVARIFPSASWFERECRDGFGIRFDGAFDERRLFLHETYPDGFHPLRKDVRNIPVTMRSTIDVVGEYPFRSVSGNGVYQVAVGPVHAGIIEPGHFRFSVIGEKIFNLEIRMFYKHRGIEKLAEGKTPQEVVRIAEAVSGDESVANATACCRAVEAIAQMTVPERAHYLRTILLELERIGSHLGDQGGMLVDVGFPLGASQFAVLREEVFRMNASLTGSRFLRGMVDVGGLSRDIPKRQLDELGEFIRELKNRYRIGLKIVLSTSSVLDRFSPTGVIRRSLLRPLNITGPMARASGGRVDVRINHPYGLYDRYPPTMKTLNDGDVLSRFTVKASEFLDSLDLIERLLADIPEGGVRTIPEIKDGYALSLVESPRGQDLCWVWIRNGTIERYKVRTASFCNWQAIEHAVQGEIVPDFPLINKSLNLSYAGTDL
ncbi:NADH-quinone oxidoreductase subunit C [Methanoregula sp.]|uniref:hydrogenase large subunit n=1 Tax=Methanoregula sp. TaxID=2052170 RepID=UPI00236F55FE|nr:NADH-quinone oxidoreductase subunit C [Methanoregula sp.]MDD1687620.1 NADH-quinone oxidoreductase subunit C [Methanoregula sp.]